MFALLYFFYEIVRTFNILELESLHLYRFDIGSDVPLLRSDSKWSSDAAYDKTFGNAEFNKIVLRLHRDNAYLLIDLDFCISSKGTSLKDIQNIKMNTIERRLVRRILDAEFIIPLGFEISPGFML